MSAISPANHFIIAPTSTSKCHAGREFSSSSTTIVQVAPNPHANCPLLGPTSAFDEISHTETSVNRIVTLSASVAKVFNSIDLLSEITAYVANTTLPEVCHTFQKITSIALAQRVYAKFLTPCRLEQAVPKPKGFLCYQEIAKYLPDYYKMMRREYIERRPHIKYQDYTLDRTMQTVPFTIFPADPRDLPLFHFEWSGDDFTSRRAEHYPILFEMDPALLVIKKVQYFLSEAVSTVVKLGESIELIDDGIQEYLKKDPQFVNRLFRYIFDQIQCPSPDEVRAAYHKNMYSLAHLLLDGYDKSLTYEVLHYTCLLHLHKIFTHEENHQNKKELFGKMLIKIVSKNSDLTAIKQDLRDLILLDESRKLKIQARPLTKKVVAIIKQYLPFFSLNRETKVSKRCVIS